MLACGLAALAAGGAASAGASSYMLSVMQDDDQMVYRTEDRDRALDRMRRLGVDAVRATVSWEILAPRKRPRNPADPRGYPATNWDRFDDLVRSATRRGIRVNLNPTAPGPRWAHKRSPSGGLNGTWKPDPHEFGLLMRALGRRYSGRYNDENQGGGLLPRVSWWGIYNEPNHGGWLTPQSKRSRLVRGWVPESPSLYRRLTIAAVAALIRTGHKDDLIAIGETAPLGAAPEEAKRPLRPALFIREMFCLNRSLRRYRGRQARARGCSNVRRLSLLRRLPRLAFGHHPYTKKSRPRRRDRNRDSITMANIGALPRLLDRIARRTDLIHTGIPVVLDEFGYESKPPDPRNGIPLSRQAKYLNEGDYLAYREPRVISTAQFLLNDVAPRAEFPRDSREYWFTYQSGLFTRTGRAKPAAAAYMMPLEVRRRSGRKHTVWGQLRFAPNGSTQIVSLQFRRRGEKRWEALGRLVKVKSYSGFYRVARTIPTGATVRAVWTEPDFSSFRISRLVRVP